MQRSKWGLPRAEQRGTITSLDLLPTPVDTAQDTVGFLGCKCVLLAHIKLFVHQNSQVFLCSFCLHTSTFRIKLALRALPL